MAYVGEDAKAMPQPEDDQLRDELGKRREISKQHVEEAKHTLSIHTAVVRACNAALEQLESEAEVERDELKKAML